jgi:hypothetical protein
MPQRRGGSTSGRGGGGKFNKPRGGGNAGRPSTDSAKSNKKTRKSQLEVSALAAYNHDARQQKALKAEAQAAREREEHSSRFSELDSSFSFNLDEDDDLALDKKPTTMHPWDLKSAMATSRPLVCLRQPTTQTTDRSPKHPPNFV